MGGGGEKKKTNAMLDQQNAQAQTEHNQYMGTVNTGLSGATGRANDMYQSMSGGLNKFISGGGNYDPTKYGTLGSGGSGGGGGGAPAVDPRFGDVESSYRNFMSGGGVDQGSFNQFQGNLKDVGASGGWSPENVKTQEGDIASMRDVANNADIANKFRGGGVYDEFAKTGGVSAANAAMQRARGNSTVPAFYDAARQEAARTASTQGGYGPGQSALMARMSRDQSKGAAEASRNTELGIQDQITKGRQWGATGMTSAEGALQGARMNALTGATSTEANMLNSIAQNRTGASAAGAGNEIGMQGLVQKGKLAGTQGLEGMAESAASRAAAASAAGYASAAQMDADRKWQAQFDREGQQYGLEGMQSLYGSRPGEVGMYLDASDTGQARANSTGGRIVDQRMSNNPQRDWVGTIGGLVGAGAGLLTGAGALGAGAKKPGLYTTPTTGNRVGG